MKPLFQLSTRKYDEEIVLVKNAMEQLEDKCNVNNGFILKKRICKMFLEILGI